MFYPKFIHLNVHSDFSIKNGLCKVDDLIKNISKMNMPSVAITDYFSLSAVIKFINTSYLYGIKPIIGADIFYYYKDIKKNIYPVTILVKNNIGYKNLVKLISKAYLYSLKNVLCVSFKVLLEINKGLIFLFPVEHNSDIGRFIFFNDLSLVKEIILFWKKILFNRIYFQISRIGNNNEDKYINFAINLSLITKVPIVATNKVLFIKKEDFFYHEIRSSIYHGCSLKKFRKINNYTKEQYLKSEEEMFFLFKDISEVLVNTVEISKMCNFSIEKKYSFIPKFNIPVNFYSSKEYLKFVVFNKIKTMCFFYKSIKKKYLDRLNYELKIINNMGFPDYFLIVMEFVSWAKKNKIPVGPGRGSGAGSLVAFVLGITNIDPLKFNLLFERFLNPKRISMPDFDIDFCMERRDEVIFHIEKLYGKFSVAQIVTFNTMTAKSVIRDVGRVLGYPYYFVDNIAKLIPFDFGISLEKALKIEKKLKYLYDSDNEVKYLINISKNLEGIIKGIGKHAGGIVISSKNIIEYCPIYYDYNSNNLVTQFDKNDIDFIGLVKFDLLGLRTLTVINNTINIINSKIKKKKININNIPLNDIKSFYLLKKADTTAVFQLESRGMKDLIKKLEPDCFEDIIALLALFRPGPLQSGMVDNFINRKKGKEPIYYPDLKWQHMLLKPILNSTYGIILYQEQVMEIARVLGNYSLESADMLRIAMCKKKEKEMKEHRKIFKKGSLKLGINVKLSLKIFSLMEKFSHYGFNKSHSVSYSFIAYQTLWLKSNYSSEFFCSVMNSDIDNNKKILSILNESKKKGIKIIYPNINKSFYYFSVSYLGEIIYGLGAIKGLGKSSIDFIIEKRNENKKFKSFVDFCFLTYSNKVNKSVLEKLIFSGCFDLFKIKRSILISSLYNIIKYVESKIRLLKTKQLSIFNNISNNNKKENIYDFFVNKSNLNKNYFLIKEKEVLGFYIKDHPINKYISNIYKKFFNLSKIKDLFLISKRKIVNVFGIINNIKFLFTKNNNRICICNIDDYSSCIDVIIFKDIYLNYSDFLYVNNIIIVSGYIKYDNIYKQSLIANKIYFYKKII